MKNSITTCHILALRWLGTGRHLAMLFSDAKSQESTNAASKSEVLQRKQHSKSSCYTGTAQCSVFSPKLKLKLLEN